MAFRQIEQQEVVPGKTVELVVNQLRGDPVLVVELLGESNGPFWSDAIAKANTKAATAGRTARSVLTAQQVIETRAKNRISVAQYAVKGLKGFRHDDGREATMADVMDLICSLPATIFDSILAFVMNPENFRDSVAVGDVADTAGK